MIRTDFERGVEAMRHYSIEQMGAVFRERRVGLPATITAAALIDYIGDTFADMLAEIATLEAPKDVGQFR